MNFSKIQVMSLVKRILISVFGVYLYAILFSELVFRAVTVRPFIGPGLLLLLPISMAGAALLYFVTLMFPEKFRNTFITLILSAGAFIGVAQIVYHSFFGTYYTVYSMLRASEVVQFWREIVNEIAACLLPVALLLAVPVIFLAMRSRLDISKGLSGIKRNVAAIAAFSFLLSALIIAAPWQGAQGQNPSRDALLKTNSIDMSVSNFGVGMAMIIDSKRLLFGFEPRIDASAAELHQNDGSIEESVDYDRNVMDIDFDALAENETDEALKSMHQYFSRQTGTYQNEKTGIFKGKNLVFVCAEGFSSLALHKEYTPTLYMMAEQGYRFSNFYNPIWGVSTSDGEYVQCTGLIPKAGVWSMKLSADKWLPFTMGNQFSKLGSKTLAYHNHYAEYYGRTDSHPNLGYVYKGLGTGLKVKEQWPESDVEMIDLTTSEYIGQEPWHVYYMTVSGHLNYNWNGNMMCRKHREDVADLKMSEACKAYIACNMEFDQAMKLLMDRLEEAGELENTVFVISGDHYPYGLTDAEISEFLGHELEPEFEKYKSALIIWTPGMEPETVDKYCSTLDIIPTISNLFGLEYDSRLLSGSDIFSTASPLIMFRDKSWITDKGKYSAKTGEGQGLSAEYIESVNKIVNNEFIFAQLILENDYYSKIIERWEAPVR